jgi:tetratricopeptide (TPR) repeat protein
MWFCIRGIFIAAVLLSPAQLVAETQLYRGNMDVVRGSGKQCEKALGKHAISLVIEESGNSLDVNGYFEGKGITIGKFSGTNPARMTVIYPYYDEERAAGNLISLSRSNTLLAGELHDKHVDEALEVCSFDLATLSLQLVAEGEPARSRMQQAARLFNSELANSKAFDLIKKGEYENALPLFEKTLDLADTALEHDMYPLDSTISGLAGSYFRLGRFKDFNRIYDERFGTVTNEWVRSMLNSQRFVVQIHLGNEALKHGEYDKALNILLPAYKLNMQSLEIMESIIASYLQNERFDEAASFLEQAVPKLNREEDRRTVVGTIAMINFLKARKDEKHGREIEAEADLRKAVFLNPDHATFWVALARLRHKAGSFEEANALLQEGLLRFKDEPSRNEIFAALEKMRRIEIILKSVR